MFTCIHLILHRGPLAPVQGALAVSAICCPFFFFFLNTTGLKVRPPGLGGWLGNTNALCGWILSSWWVAEHVCQSCFLSDDSNLTDVTVQYVQSHWSQNNSELEKENRSDRKQHFFFFGGGDRKGGCEEPLDDFTDIQLAYKTLNTNSQSILILTCFL